MKSFLRPLVYSLLLSVPIGASYTTGYRGRNALPTDSLSFGDGAAVTFGLFVFLFLFLTGLQFLGVRIAFSEECDDPSVTSEKKIEERQTRTKGKRRRLCIYMIIAGGVLVAVLLALYLLPIFLAS